MIRPIAPQVAVFAAVQINPTRFATVNATRLLLTKVAVSTVFRKQRDALIGLTSHTPCYRLIESYERTRSKDFRWVLRVRTDVVYRRRMPSWLPELPRKMPPTVWVEFCGPHGGSMSPVCPRTNRDGTFGCAKDTWALMTRAAACVYFDAHMLQYSTRYCHRDLVGRLTHRRKTTSAECRLGCALNRAAVTVRTIRIDRSILRNGLIQSVPSIRGEIVLDLTPESKSSGSNVNSV